jgi:hypothetical protein
MTAYGNACVCWDERGGVGGGGRKKGEMREAARDETQMKSSVRLPGVGPLLLLPPAQCCNHDKIVIQTSRISLQMLLLYRYQKVKYASLV